MKLNLILHENESISTLDNLHPSQLETVIDSSCELINCHRLFEINHQLIPEILKKVQKEGTIDFTVTNAVKACGDFSRGVIDVMQLSSIMGMKTAYFDLNSIGGLLANSGFEVVQVTSRDYYHKIIARRK